MQRLIAIAVLAAGTVGSAFAADDDRPFKFLAGIGLTGGGSTLATVQYTNGDTQNIKSGGLVMLYAGGETRIGTAVALQFTAGYHVDDSDASNGSVRFSRYPVEVIALASVSDTVRLGGGVRFVNNPKLKGSGVASNVNQSFDSTVGIVLEGEYRFTPWLGLKLRGVNEKYKFSGSNNEVSGNHVGVLVNFYF